MQFNLPTALTWFRIALIPVFMLVFYQPYPWARPASAIIFALAAITDMLDGYLARKLGQTSAFGAFLDPVADKLMVAVALVLIVEKDPIWYITLPAAIIIGREITVSALREWMAELGASHHVAVSAFGKLKTNAQMWGLAFMLYLEPLLGLPIYRIGHFMLLAAAGLTLWSMFRYIRAAWPIMSTTR